MSNNKQSSVEWQFEQLSKSFETLKNTRLSFDEYYKRNLEIREQAKAMHKEEMKQTYFDGWHRNIGNRDEDFEQYYNETYGGNNEQQ